MSGKGNGKPGPVLSPSGFQSEDWDFDGVFCCNATLTWYNTGISFNVVPGIGDCQRLGFRNPAGSFSGGRALAPVGSAAFPGGKGTDVVFEGSLPKKSLVFRNHRQKFPDS